MSLYLDLLRDVLLNRHYGMEAAPISLERVSELKEQLNQTFAPWLRDGPESPQAAKIREILAHDTQAFAVWLRSNARAALALQPASGLDNVVECVQSALREGVPGDLFECGVWRGAVPILMRAVLKEAGVTDRRVWALDSFEGLPAPDLKENPMDYLSYEVLRLIGGLAMDLPAVQANFAMFDLLDDQVRFVPGWFEQILPTLAVPPIAVLRLDADFYESTVPLLRYLYPHVSSGGFVIIDDYGIPHMEAGRAVDEYRTEHNITAELVPVNGQTVFWRKS